MANDLNQKQSTVYKRLKLLAKLNYISLNSNNKYTMITIVNYNIYQELLSKKEKRGMNKGKENDKPGNTNKNDKNVKKFIAPTLEEVKEYVISKGFDETLAIRAYEYYDSADWHDSKGNKVRNWKQKILAVWLKEENKIQKEENLIEFKRDE